MTQDSASGPRPGETGLIVAVPEAEPVVGRWRAQFDSAAAAGIPAHVTVLYPFLDRDLIDAGVLAELAALMAKHQAFALELRECRRFPEVLYLAPVPDTGLLALTDALTSRWPETPPYRGQFSEVVPHLTIAHGHDPEVLDMVEHDVARQLPIVAYVGSVHLVTYDGRRWNTEHSFFFGPATMSRGDDTRP